MINRNSYINKLIKLRDKQIIKVITGIRRSGKSTLLLQYIDYLKSDGVNDDRIIYINLESAKYDFIRNYHDLYAYINQKKQSFPFPIYFSLMEAHSRPHYNP